MTKKYVPIFVVFFIHCLTAQLTEKDIKRLMKFFKKIKKEDIPIYNCVAPEKVKKIIKRLSSNNVEKRSKAFAIIKVILQCEQTRKYIEKEFDKFPSITKYMIINAAYKMGINLDIPAVTKNVATQISAKNTYNEYNDRYDVEYSKRYIFNPLKTCHGTKKWENDTFDYIGNDNYYNKEELDCNALLSLKNSNDLSRLLSLLFKCLHNKVNILLKNKNSSNHKKFVKELSKKFKSSIVDISIVFFSRYTDLQKHSQQEKYNEKYYLSNHEQFLYIQGILFYFFTHILKKGNLLGKIVNSIAGDDFTLSVYLTMPIIKSRRTIYIFGSVISKLNSQRIFRNEILFKGFLCMYYLFENICKDFKKVDFTVVNPIDSFDTISKEIQNCIK